MKFANKDSQDFTPKNIGALAPYQNDHWSMMSAGRPGFALGDKGGLRGQMVTAMPTHAPHMSVISSARKAMGR